MFPDASIVGLSIVISLLLERVVLGLELNDGFPGIVKIVVHFFKDGRAPKLSWTSQLTLATCHRCEMLMPVNLVYSNETACTLGDYYRDVKNSATNDVGMYINVTLVKLFMFQEWPLKYFRNYEFNL